MRIYLPEKDILKSLQRLTNEDFEKQQKTAYHIIRILESKLPAAKILSGGKNGTIKFSSNGTITHAHNKEVLRWEHYPVTLIQIFNMMLMLKPNPKYSPISSRVFFQSSNPNGEFFTEDQLEYDRFELLDKNFKHYSVFGW